MSADPDKQVFGAVTGLGCFSLALGLILIPPLILPALLLVKLVSFAGKALHPALVVLFAAALAWGLYRLAGFLIRAVRPSWARGSIALYVGACYTFVIFQRELTTARSELDVTWLAFTMLIFTAIGWKAAGTMVIKAHRDQLIRARRSTS